MVTRPTSYVTRIPGREAWRKIMDEYRRNGPTLGVAPANELPLTRESLDEQTGDDYKDRI